MAETGKVAASAVADAGTAGCVYCLGSQALAARQVLRCGRFVYLCAPLGQWVEGFVCIAPYACTPCLAQLPRAALDEVAAMQQTVRSLYAAAYRGPDALFYEQGRGGGGARQDPASGFALHAHLCALPLADPALSRLPERLVAQLTAQFDARALEGVADLPAICDHQPYLYVQTPQEALMLQGRDAIDGQMLERARLKPLLTALCGMPERGDWRAWPGHAELDRLIHHWRWHGHLPPDEPTLE